MKLIPQTQRWVKNDFQLRVGDAPSDFPQMEIFNPPYPLCQREETDNVDDDSAILEEQRSAYTVDEPVQANSIEPVYIPGIAHSVSALMAQLARLFQEQDQRREKNQRQHMDRKQRREIDEKKQAMGIRD